METIQYVVCLLLSIYWGVLIARIVLSYVPALPEPIEPLARGVRALTDPLLEPLRRTIPPVRAGAIALDLSPLILFFAIAIIRSLLC